MNELTESSIRQQYAEAQRRLAEVEHERLRLDQERIALTKLVDGFAAWLQLYGAPATVPTTTPFPAGPMPNGVVKSQFESKGAIGMKKGLLRVLEAARPESLRIEVLLEKAYQAGVATNAKYPLTVLENHAIALVKEGKAERTAPRTFRAINA